MVLDFVGYSPLRPHGSFSFALAFERHLQPAPLARDTYCCSRLRPITFKAVALINIYLSLWLVASRRGLSEFPSLPLPKPALGEDRKTNGEAPLTRVILKHRLEEALSFF